MMNRLVFLRHLAGSALGLTVAPGLVARPAKARPPVRVYEGYVAGFAYHVGPRCLAQLAAGEALTLRREPDNPHDGRAIACYYGRQRLGYVPRRDNKVLTHLLDGGASLTARLSAVSPAHDDWAKLKFEVFLHT